MTQRIDYEHVAPAAVAAIAKMGAYLRSRSLDSRLRSLIEIRISQINGCAFCIDLHTREAREAGESVQRIDCLPVWHEVPFYSEREKAALAWAESVTLVSQTRVPDAVFEQVSAQFSEEEIVDLTMIVVAINTWNRMAISFRKLPVERATEQENVLA